MTQTHDAETVERVAKAMADSNGDILDDLKIIERGTYRRQARAALRALSEKPHE